MNRVKAAAAAHRMSSSRFTLQCTVAAVTIDNNKKHASVFSACHFRSQLISDWLLIKLFNQLMTTLDSMKYCICQVRRSEAVKCFYFYQLSDSQLRLNRSCHSLFYPPIQLIDCGTDCGCLIAVIKYYLLRLKLEECTFPFTLCNYIQMEISRERDL